MEVAGGCYNSGIVGSGAGGSSFISGYTGANAIEETSTLENIVHTGNSMHYSGRAFVDSQMLDGNASMPSHDGRTTMTGNSGNGFAKISFISDLSSDSSLKTLKVDKGTMVEEFSSEVHEYTVKLNENEYIVNFELETNDPLASVEESEYINILVAAGKSKHKINVYAQDGTRTQYIINFERTASSCSYINGITISDKYYKFTEGVYNYELALPYDTPDIAKIEYFKANELQTINGSQYINVSEDNKTLTFKVVAEDGTTKEYRLTLNREHNVYLKNIELIGFNLNPKFNAETTEYTIQVLNSMTNVNIYAVAYDKNSVITITGQDNISVGSTITITVTNPYISDTKVYTITCEQASTETQYSYSGEYKEFIAPYTGLYKFECWGGIGGKSRRNGSLYSVFGKGGYAKGEINLTKGEKLYVYVGENGHDSVVGQDSLATWNGGGLGTWDRSDNETSGSGGGATDIRLISGNWNDSKSLASRIMVAGGAGGTSWSYTPGNGGGISGTTSYSGSPAGTQTSGYLFGIGRDGWGVADNDGVAGGGRRILWRTN